MIIKNTWVADSQFNNFLDSRGELSLWIFLRVRIDMVCFKATYQHYVAPYPDSPTTTVCDILKPPVIFLYQLYVDPYPTTAECDITNSVS